MSALTEALRKKYRNRGAALAALGLDASIIEEEGEKMVRPLTVQQSALYLQHVAEQDARDRARASGRLAYDAMPRRGSRDDDRRRGRDEEEPEREPHEELQELLAELEPEEQQIVLDAVYDMLAKKGGVDYGSDRRRARDRRRAADQPPLFEGRPEPGGTMTWSEREARDRRRATFANDMAQGTGRGFLDFFPDAKRIGTGGGF